MLKESSTAATAAAASKDANNMAQRKRSYDVHPPSHATESSTGPPTIGGATVIGGPGGAIGIGGGALIPRRHSMAKVHQQSIEAPIRKVCTKTFSLTL